MSRTDRLFLMHSVLFIANYLYAIVDHLWHIGNTGSPESVLLVLQKSRKSYIKFCEGLNDE